MFRYRDAKGIEHVLPNETALHDAILAGDIHASTPLSEAAQGGWGLAGRHPAFTRAQKAMSPVARLRSAQRRGRGLARWTQPRVVVPAALAFVLLVGGGFTVGHLRERALAEQRHAYATAMLGLANGHAPAPELLAAAVGAPIADDAALRSVWVRFQVARAMARSADSAQTAHRVRGFLPPEEWMSDDYVRNARAFPAIAEHWANYLEWDRAWSEPAEDRLFLENARYAIEAGLSERETFELIDPAQPGLAAVGWDLELRRQFAAEAQRLHTALVESRGNVVLDEGQWWFADTRTQRAYTEHTGNLRRIAAALRDNAARRAAGYGVPTPAGAVPDNVSRMRFAGR